MLEVKLDADVLYRSSVPICRADRSAAASQGQATRVEFSFRPARGIVWQGYRDADDKTAANQLLTFDLWQAGADPDDLILGITVRDRSTIYMNTTHVAKPGDRASTEIASGLTVSTYASGKGDSSGN
jgi:hypothetical protein